MRKKKPTKAVKDPRKTIDDTKSIEELLSDIAPTQKVFEPPTESLARLGAIPLLFDEPLNLATGFGTVVYDSWAEGPAVALRAIKDGHIRRIKVKSGKVSCEIVAERSRGQWEFVARVYRGKSVAHNFVMTVGKKKLLSESGGYFRWSSKRVPRKLGLTSNEERFKFEEISW